MSTTSDTAVFVVGFRWEAAVPEQGIVGCFHRNLSVEADELARPVSLLLRAHLIDESAGEFRLEAVLRFVSAAEMKNRRSHSNVVPLTTATPSVMVSVSKKSAPAR